MASVELESEDKSANSEVIKTDRFIEADQEDDYSETQIAKLAMIRRRASPGRRRGFIFGRVGVRIKLCVLRGRDDARSTRGGPER